MNKTEWKKIRSKIIRRDAYRCRVIDCNAKGANNLTVHHIIPRDEGGGDYDANLITLCPKHHDEIEIAGIRVVALIEAWENAASTECEKVSRTILDVQRSSKNGRDTQAVTVHLCAESTVAAVNRMKNETRRPWADLAKQLGYPVSFAATLSAISRDIPGAASEAVEDELRQRIVDSDIEPIKAERTAIRNEITEKKQIEDEARRCSPSTADNIARFDSLPTKPTWLKLALSDVRNGKPMSLKRERRMCEALGIEPPPVMVETPACPDCGSVHNGGRCNGKPVTVRLVRQRTPPPAWVAEATANLAALLERKRKT